MKNAHLITFISFLLAVQAAITATLPAATYTVLHNFTGASGDGAIPYDSLTLAGSTLYGMTYQGGTDNGGVVFKMNLDGSGFQVLHTFLGYPLDGDSPQGSLTLSGSTLYGMTETGGTSNPGGTVFKINTDGSAYQLLCSIGDAAADAGAFPDGSLTLSGSTLYGMTSSGGGFGDGGVAFKLDTSGLNYTNLHTFAGGINDGLWPMDSLTLSGSTLYGMTEQGGVSNKGVIFKINTDGSGFQLLHTFVGDPCDGDFPYGSLTLSGSTLYGMTFSGNGVIFKINTDGTDYSILHRFAWFTIDGYEGIDPMGSLILSGTTLYGMTTAGGADNAGTIFKINTDGTGYTTLYEFLYIGKSYPYGSEPYGSLTLSGSTLYGMTSKGGTSDKGVVFALSLTTTPPDTTPDPFTFAAQTGVTLSTTVTSNTITVSGINAAAPITITGGAYSINSGACTTAPGTVNNGNTVTVRQTSSGSYLSTTNATLTIGGVSGTFSVTTRSSSTDMTPPTATITSPTSNPTYPTSSSPLSIGGTASDNIRVTQVTWLNNRGGNGTCSGTTSWSASGITLYSGQNVITVTARDAANNTGTDTLTVTFTPQTGQVCKFGSFDTQTNVKRTLKDCYNNDVTFSLSGGGYGEIDPCDCHFGQIELYNTTDKSVLTISTKGKTETSVGDIIVNDSLKGISAKTTNLRGDITVTGSLGTLTLNDVADDHTITIGSPSILNTKAAVTIIFDYVADLTINSQMPIKSISATEWLGGSINAPSIGSITTKGDKKRGIAGDLDVNVMLDGSINSAKVAGTLFGVWQCDSIKSVSASDVVETNLTLNQPPDAKVLALGSLIAKGEINSSQILSQGNIGTVTAGAIIDSSCFAGVAEGITGLPDAEAASFSETASIKSIAIKGIRTESPPYYINSNIAATNILSASIAYPQSDNGGVPFGLSADNIKKLTIKKTDGTTTSLKELKESKDSQTIDGVEIRLY